MTFTIGNLYYTQKNQYAWILNEEQKNSDVIDLRIDSKNNLENFCIQNMFLLYLGTKTYEINFWSEVETNDPQEFNLELKTIKHIGHLFLASENIILLENGINLTNKI